MLKENEKTKDTNYMSQLKYKIFNSLNSHLIGDFFESTLTPERKLRNKVLNKLMFDMITVGVMDVQALCNANKNYLMLSYDYFKEKYNITRPITFEDSLKFNIKNVPYGYKKIPNYKF